VKDTGTQFIEEWHADIEISEDFVKKLLQEQFAELNPITSIQYLGEGWDNKVFLANKKTVFRFPRRKLSVELQKQENIILKNLPDFSSVRIPRLQFIGQATALYPYPFQGYEVIPGVPAYQANLSMEERSANITALALFLKQLHAINSTQAQAIGVVPQSTDNLSNVEQVISRLERCIAKISTRGLCHINYDCLKQEIAVAKRLVLSGEPCLVHGDLDGRQLIFNDKKLIGIIDWGDVDISTRVLDLEVVWSFYPSSCHAKFFEIYGEVEHGMWSYARFLALYTSFSLLLYGADIQDAKLVTEATHSIIRINANLLM